MEYQEVSRLTERFRISTAIDPKFPAMLDQDPRTAEKGKEILPLDMGYLPDFFQKKAEQELHETPEKTVQCMWQLKELIKGDKHLSHLNFQDDNFLLAFLRGRKFDVEKTLARLRHLVLMCFKHPETVSPWSFEETSKTVTDRIVTVLPWRCHEGCAVILFQLDNWNPATFSVDATKRTVSLLLFRALQDPMTQVNGFKVIFDVKSSSTLRYLKHCTPQNLWILYYGTLECSAGRYKGIHIVHDSRVFKASWLVIKNFCSAKLKQRIHFHSSTKTLLDFFPRDVLPIQYGGNLENYDQTEWFRSAMSPKALANVACGIFQDLQSR